MIALNLAAGLPRHKAHQRFTQLPLHRRGEKTHDHRHLRPHPVSRRAERFGDEGHQYQPLHSAQHLQHPQRTHVTHKLAGGCVFHRHISSQGSRLNSQYQIPNIHRSSLIV